MKHYGVLPHLCFTASRDNQLQEIPLPGHKEKGDIKWAENE
jgi:hypothetical protein